VGWNFGPRASQLDRVQDTVPRLCSGHAALVEQLVGARGERGLAAVAVGEII